MREKRVQHLLLAFCVLLTVTTLLVLLKYWLFKIPGIELMLWPSLLLGRIGFQYTIWASPLLAGMFAWIVLRRLSRYKLIKTNRIICVCLLTFYLCWVPGLIYYYLCPVPQPTNLTGFPPYFFQIDRAVYEKSYRYAMLDLWLEDHDETHVWSYAMGFRAGLSEWESLWPGVINSDRRKDLHDAYLYSLKPEPDEEE